LLVLVETSDNARLIGVTAFCLPSWFSQVIKPLNKQGEGKYEQKGRIRFFFGYYSNAGNCLNFLRVFPV